MMPMILYNSRSRQKEPFHPLIPGHVKLYVCGMTVYDLCHIGHARTMVCFDVLARAMREMGYEVTYARNITDIDDKIINRAKERNETPEALAKFFTQELTDDSNALNIVPPDEQPRATEYVNEMIAMIQTLVDKGYAYVAKHGDVCYEVSRFPAYGQLSGQDLEKLRSGSRVAVADDKRDPLDFVLWKTSKPGEPSWPSPWGEGRPGWHIECSAMSCKLVGKHFDIHGGGTDLLFPHHEHELAQSEAATGEKFVNVWMHCGFVQINHEKMSKSLNNFFTIRDVLKEYPAEVLRYFLTLPHYRSPINYSIEALNQTAQSLDRLYFTLRDLDMESVDYPKHEEFSRRFIAALADDLNTPEAFAVLFELAREINRLKPMDMKQASSFGKLLVKLSAIVGICQQDPDLYFQKKGTTESSDHAAIDVLIKEREEARKTKNWQRADVIRDILDKMGVVIDDTPGGAKWRKLEKK